MNRVLVFRRDLLPLSETFVRQQLTGLRDWRATLVGNRREASGLDLAGLDVRLVEPSDGGIMQRLAWRAYCMVGWPVPGSIRSLKDPGFVLVHAHFATDAVAAWPWLRRLGVPVVVTLHGYDIKYPSGVVDSGQRRHLASRVSGQAPGARR